MTQINSRTLLPKQTSSKEKIKDHLSAKTPPIVRKRMQKLQGQGSM